MIEPSDGEAMEAWELSNGLFRVPSSNYYSVFKSVTRFGPWPEVGSWSVYPITYGVNDYVDEWTDDGWDGVRPFPRLDATALLARRIKGNARLMRTGFSSWWRAIRG